MELEIIKECFTVCKLREFSKFDFSGNFFFTAKTDDEISLVCPTYAVPINTLAREDGFRAFRICGILDFSLTGILSRLSGILAERNIGIFAVSTFNTDYIFVKAKDLDAAKEALSDQGYLFL